MSPFNPVVDLISAFRRSLYGVVDVNIGSGFRMILLFMTLCLGIIRCIFRSGYRLKA